MRKPKISEIAAANIFMDGSCDVSNIHDNPNLVGLSNFLDDLNGIPKSIVAKTITMTKQAVEKVSKSTKSNKFKVEMRLSKDKTDVVLSLTIEGLQEM